MRESIWTEVVDDSQLLQISPSERWKVQQQLRDAAQ